MMSQKIAKEIKGGGYLKEITGGGGVSKEIRPVKEFYFKQKSGEAGNYHIVLQLVDSST